MVMSSPTVLPDPLKELETEAYESAAKEPHGDYSHIGPAVFAPPFRAGKLREWPLHTDFRPEDLEVKD
jgi:hypothetical protein